MKQVGWKTPSGRFIPLRMNVSVSLPAGSVAAFVPDDEHPNYDKFKSVGFVSLDGLQRNLHAFSGGEHLHRQEIYIARALSDPMDVRRSEFAALQKTVAELTGVNTVVEPEASRPLRMMPTELFLRAAIKFCADKLEPFADEDFDSDSEVACKHANIYIRELVARLRSGQP